jgi:hypothetical protein
MSEVSICPTPSCSSRAMRLRSSSCAVISFLSSTVRACSFSATARWLASRSVHHLIEGVGQRADLVVGPVRRPRLQVAAPDLFGGGDQVKDRARQQPGQDHGGDDARQRHEQRRQIICPVTVLTTVCSRASVRPSRTTPALPSMIGAIISWTVPSLLA